MLVPVAPYRFAVLLLCVGPKPVPLIVMLAPTGPAFGEMLVMESCSRTVNCTPLVVIPSSVTVTGPLVAFAGTVIVMLVSLQELTPATTLLTCTVLLPWLEPKPTPFKMIDPPISAAGGERLLIMAWITVKMTLERLGMEFTVTTTGLIPDGAVVGTRATICVSLQLVMDVDNAPLKLTVLVPCVAPKLEPVIVTDVPTVPRLGNRPVTKGVVPKLIETLSKVPVASDAGSPPAVLLLTANPT